MLAQVLSFGRNPRGSPDFLAYSVPKACMHVLGTGVLRPLVVARSALSPKAAQALGCSLTPGLRISFGRVTCMARAASVPGLWTPGFLLLCGACVWVWVVVGLRFRLQPATPGWGVGVCVCLRARSACTRHSWLGCAAWVCVLGLRFWLRPATPGRGFGACVCLCARPACTPPLLAGVCDVGVGAWAPVLAAPCHSWLGCWGLCVLGWPLRLYPASPGWAVRCGCVCLGSGFDCAPPLLAGVLGPVCVCVRAPLVPRHSWLRCAVSVCVLRLGFRLRPATPGLGVGVHVCLRARSACTPPLLAGVCGVGVCPWARVSAAPRHSWLGCWGVCVFVCALCLYHATCGSVVRCGCVCWGSDFGCTPPLLAGVLGCVCACVGAPLVLRHSWLGCAAWVFLLGLRFRLRPATPGWGVGVCVCLVRAPLVPRHSWLGCAVWACVFGLGLWPLPATPGWGVGLCVFVCALRLYPATPGWGVRCGCVCLGSGFGCAPPLLAGVFGCVCACMRAPLVPRHSWLGCAMWVCVLGLGFRLRPATPGWGVGACVCLCARSACTPPLLAGVCGLGVCAWARVSAASGHPWLGCWDVCVLGARS